MLDRVYNGGVMKPQAIGTIGITRARLFDSNGNLIGYCIDTPNGIAKAFMECPQAKIVRHILGIDKRDYYNNRMKSWNKAHSDLEVL